MLVDANLHDAPYETLLAELPAHIEIDNVAIKFNNNKFGRLEGWPCYYTMKGNPWASSANGYCNSDTDTDCNMPTMWITISFRDALKLSVSKMPKIKDSKFASTGIDLSPRFVRKHGGKLPFQLSSVNGTHWDCKSFYNRYYKKFSNKLNTGLKKLGDRSISPVAVFRFRVGFDYSETLINAGEYNLPASIVSD